MLPVVLNVRIPKKTAAKIHERIIDVFSWQSSRAMASDTTIVLQVLWGPNPSTLMWTFCGGAEPKT